MFHFLKKKNCTLLAPIDGKVVSLDEVPDPVFSSRMMGDGVAIQTTGDVAYAPADGVITVTIETKHAFGMSLDNGMELIVHVGLDTVDAKGEGFEMLVKEHEKVTVGTPILKINRESLKDHNLITPVIVTNPEVFEFADMHIGEEVKGGESVLIEYH